MSLFRCADYRLVKHIRPVRVAGSSQSPVAAVAIAAVAVNAAVAAVGIAATLAAAWSKGAR